MRHVFDRLAGLAVTARCVTPKRPHPLPEVLSREETLAMLAAAPSTRDQLILGRLYGCGLQVRELCRLTWEDIDPAGGSLRVRHALRKERLLEIPPDLLPVLEPEDFVSPLARVRQIMRERERQTAAPPPPSLPEHTDGKLFKAPISLAGLELPFRDESTLGIAAGFYRLLKTHILGRFLCLRRPNIRAG